MSNNDDDLAEQCPELNEGTLEDKWAESDGPPEQYGRPGPRTIMDGGNDITHAWSWNSTDDEIAYDGELAWVVR